MKQHEAVIKVMEENGGFATLGFLNKNVLQVEGCKWATNTPYASIRRIVQNPRFFFKIRPGLWALNSYKNKLPFELENAGTKERWPSDEFDHTYLQRLLLEIGNLKGFKTTVANQDKNKTCLGKRLAEVATRADPCKFSYERIVQKALSVDVVWFNRRSMPDSLFEVEHSTDIQGALLKFVEFQDFYLSLYIVANEARRAEFSKKLSLDAFEPVQERVQFMSYDKVAEWHQKMHQLAAVETEWKQRPARGRAQCLDVPYKVGQQA